VKTEAEMKKKKVNYKAFPYVGIIYIASGTVFLIAVNRAIGIALIALGIIYIVLGANKLKKKLSKKH
jgi:uncharacterized membrane protein HdeD (DUF308 family)